MKVVLVTQARIGSTRLPGKVLLKIGDQTLMDIHLTRVSKSKMVSEFVVATTIEEGSDDIIEIAKKYGFKGYKGSVSDVLDRFYKATYNFTPDWIVRVTSDCPLLDPALIDAVVKTALENNCDYCSNTLQEDFPDGQDIEVFKFSALSKAWEKAGKEYEREHVTPFIWNNSDFKGGVLFKAINVSAPFNYNNVRMTVDEKADLEMMKWLIGELGIDKGWLEYTEFILHHPDKIFNAGIHRNEGYLKSLNKITD